LQDSKNQSDFFLWIMNNAAKLRLTVRENFEISVHHAFLNHFLIGEEQAVHSKSAAKTFQLNTSKEESPENNFGTPTATMRP
jgi:hypothetical protein